MTARPFKGGRSEAGGGLWPQWPERALLQGAKVTSRISGESEPLMRRASESLNVRHEYDQQRRTRCGAWCEERAGAASPAASLRARGCVFICSINCEKQRGDVKRAGASARTSEHDRASSYPVNRWGRIAAPLRTLRAPSAHSHMLRGPAYFVLLSRASFINF